MSGGLERSYRRRLLVKSPQSSLFDELRTASSIIRFIPLIGEYRPTDDERVARVQIPLSLGPVAWRAVGRLELSGLDPPHALGVNIIIPNPAMDILGAMTLEVADATETNLEFSATARTEHSVLRRMRSSVVGALEEYVDTTVERIAILTRQYAAAARRLAELDDTHRSQ